MKPLDNDSSEEVIPLLESKKSKKNYDYLALCGIIFIKLGSAVEFSLPAVVSQPISCELGISRTQEHILALSLYFAIMAANGVTSKVTANRPRKTCILFGLYTTIFILIFCALVPNYSSLLASRILLGLCDGIKYGPSLVYIAEIVSTESFYRVALVTSTFVYTIGGAWCGIVGYFFMDLVGWRYFFLISSLPLFIPPIILFQFCLPETYVPKNEQLDKKQLDFDMPTPKKDMVGRILMSSIFSFCYTNYFFGATLLVPSIARSYNQKNRNESPCAAIHGGQFLILGVLFGVCHLVGNVIWYILGTLKVSKRKLLVGASVINTLTFGALCFQLDNITLLYIGIGVTQAVSMVTHQEILFLSSDKDFFTPDYLTISIGTFFGFFTVACMTGNMIAELMTYKTAIVTYFGISIFGVIVSPFVSK